AKGPPPASKFFLRNLPSIPIPPSSDRTCPICVDHFTSDAKQLPCAHAFHKECITPWMELHNTCPICRREYPTDDPAYEKQRKEREAAANRAQGLPVEEEEEEWDPFYG
ncbi:hypothetical protein BDK51DRAFT_32101, partial [Blyttiomyces helicus]